MSEFTAIGVVHTIESDGVRAEIGTVAAVLAGLWSGDTVLSEPLPRITPPPGGAGIVLAPWPNRVRDGRWTLNGSTQQLDLTEPAFGNATHGLLRNTEYAVREMSPSSITLGARIPPQHGFPFTLDTWVRYEVGTGGLTVTHGAENLGAVRAPWAVGAHPYLRVGAQPVPELTLTVPALQYAVTDERNLPVRDDPVAVTPVDARAGLLLAHADLNTAYSDFAPGDDDALAWLEGEAGRTSLWAGPDFRYVQAFTNRAFPNAEGMAVALEPMTAAADALNSGAGLRWLEPGETWTGRWGVRYSPR